MHNLTGLLGPVVIQYVVAKLATGFQKSVAHRSVVCRIRNGKLALFPAVTCKRKKEMYIILTDVNLE